jgi:hypothetical protein
MLLIGYRLISNVVSLHLPVFRAGARRWLSASVEIGSGELWQHAFIKILSQNITTVPNSDQFAVLAVMMVFGTQRERSRTGWFVAMTLGIER